MEKWMAVWKTGGMDVWVMENWVRGWRTGGADGGMEN